MTAISLGSRQDAAMIISVLKTKAMHIHKSIQVTETKEEEIEVLHLKHKCPDCQRAFPTLHGLRVHMGRWCDGGQTIRSRKGSKQTKLFGSPNAKLQRTCAHMYTSRERRSKTSTHSYISEASFSAMGKILQT